MHLSGPEISPKNNMQATCLIVLFHGYGQTGSEILQLFASQLSQEFPTAHIFAPNAPSQSIESATGFDWISYNGIWEDKYILKQLNKIEKYYNETIAIKLKQLNLQDNRLILLGFSQGARVILHIGLKRKNPCAGIVCYSGKMTLPDVFIKQILSLPRILLIHGVIDDVITIKEHKLTADVLYEAGADVVTECIAGLAHEINDSGISLGVNFIATCLNEPYF